MRPPEEDNIGIHGGHIGVLYRAIFGEWKMETTI